MRIELASLLVACLAGSGAAQIGGSYRLSFEGCPDASLLYEQFAPGSFDLSTPGSLDWLPNSGSGYIVLRGNAPLLSTAGGLNLNLLDEAVSPPVNLGFSFPYPTGLGSTTQVEVSSNGYVYLEPGTIFTPRCCNGLGPILNQFRADTPSWAVLGMNLDPGAGGGVYLNSSPTMAWITWENVPEYGQLFLNTVQIQLHASGMVSLIYSPAANMRHTALVGWSGGYGVDDDGPFDFSANIPFNMGPSSGPLTVTAPFTRLPTLGQVFQVDVRNVPSDALAGVLLFSASTANLNLDPVGMTGCGLFIGSQIAIFPMALTPPVGVSNVPIPLIPQLAGVSLESQGAVVAPSVNTFGISTSNRGTMRIGNVSNPVIVRADGIDNENADESAGFWNVINATSLDIVSVRLDWLRSSVPNAYYFDTNQTGMADRFDGGSSTTPLCQNTFRNDTDSLVGLVYNNTPVTPCGNGNLGWVGSGFGRSPGDYRAIDFAFSNFKPGMHFEFDADTDGGPGNGGAMAGLLVTVKMSDNSTRTGELVMISPTAAEVVL